MPPMILFSAKQLELKEVVAASYKQLCKARDVFLSSLKQDANLPAWSPLENPGARLQAASVYGDFFFPSGTRVPGATSASAATENKTKLARNVVTKGYGVIGASSRTVDLALGFNKAKADFDAQLEPLRNLSVEVDRGPGKAKEQMHLCRAILKECHIPLLSQKQACRRILIWKEIPESIAFMWGKSESICRLTVSEAKKILADMNTTPDVAADMRFANSLPDDEPLAYVEDISPHMRIRIGIRQTPDPNDPNELKRQARATGERTMKDRIIIYKINKTAMPMLLLMSPGDVLPTIKPPKVDPNSEEDVSSIKTVSRKKPNSSPRRKLESTPCFRTLDIYRYQSDQRDEVSRDEKWIAKLAKACKEDQESIY